MSIEVGDYVQHTSRNVVGRVVRIADGIVTLDNEHSGSLHYFIKVSDPKINLSLTLLISSVIISLASLITQLISLK